MARGTSWLGRSKLDERLPSRTDSEFLRSRNRQATWLITLDFPCRHRRQIRAPTSGEHTSPLMATTERRGAIVVGVVVVRKPRTLSLQCPSTSTLGIALCNADDESVGVKRCATAEASTGAVRRSASQKRKVGAITAGW